MKKKLLFAACFAVGLSSFAQVGINTTAPEGALDVVSTNSGLVVPRVATIDAVTTPINGMVVYDVAEKCFKGYADEAWKAITPCTPVPIPSSAITVASPTYQGVSPIDAMGIGYNGEAIPAASTITVQATTTQAGPYTLTATDAATGLVYTAAGTFTTVGTHAVVLTPNSVVMPEFESGVINMTLTGASNTLTLEPRIDIKSMPSSATAVVTINVGTQTWMDRNLGARRAATASDDVFSYGGYFQWGRPADGHEIVVINGTTKNQARGLYGTTTTLALDDNTGTNNNFIDGSSPPNDWRSDNNNNRWATIIQGPCPAGFHVPSEIEYQLITGVANELTSVNVPLNVPNAGARNLNGAVEAVGAVSTLWTRTVEIFSNQTQNESVEQSRAILNGYSGNVAFRALGLSVRCVKDSVTTGV